VWFITLVLLPFTAPFPTYQIDPATGHPFDALPKEFKNKIDSDDGLILPSDCRVPVPVFDGIAFRRFLRSNQVIAPPVHHIVLRL
jgi:hypothetical protein